MNIILFSVVTIVVVGLFVGLFLGVASEKLAVEVDEKEVAIRSELPGNNCGGCGYPGCDGLAHAICIGEANVDGCPVGGQATANAIGAIMGQEVEEKEKQVAYVKCDGTCLSAKPLYFYSGIRSCNQSKALGSSPKACQWGCLGFGDCVSVCPFDAIHIDKGIAKVDEDKCKACGKCVAICPNHMIDIVPYHKEIRVMCHSEEKGVDARNKCDVGCIGCGICQKQCVHDAIHVINNIAIIDYDKCIGCGKCSVACPRKAIHIIHHNDN